MFFNTDLSPSFFFAQDGYPIIRLKKKPLGKWHHRLKALAGKTLCQYAQKIVDSAMLVEKKFGTYYPGVPHHNIDAYRKSDYSKAVEEVFKAKIRKTLQNQVLTFCNLTRTAIATYA